MPKAGKIVNESQDQRYFTITPRLIWALSRNPYDYTFWSVVKGIAGESGECYLESSQLAVLAMMSSGQVVDSRKYWIKIGMLNGAMKKDPGFPQAVFHLSVPNIWKANLEWAEKHTGIKERIEFKLSQKQNIEEERKAFMANKKSVHPVKPIQITKERSPGEPERSPGETKKNHLRISIKNMGADAPALTDPQPVEQKRRTDAVVRGDAMDGVLFYAAQAEARTVEEKALEHVAGFPADCQDGARLVYRTFKLLPPEKPKSGKGGDYAYWINGIRALQRICSEYGVSLQIGFEEVYKNWNASPFDYKSPSSFEGPMKSALARLSLRETPQTPAPPVQPEQILVSKPAYIQRPRILRPRTSQN
jgi:hypothetical protein